MESKVFRILDSNNCLIDVSLSERRCKRYATLNDYNSIGYRVGYNAVIFAKKIKNKWVKVAQ